MGSASCGRKKGVDGGDAIEAEDLMDGSCLDLENRDEAFVGSVASRWDRRLACGSCSKSSE